MGVQVSSSPLGSARSFLFVPGSRPERFEKALSSGADAVIIDLEDAVAQECKQQAREVIAAAWANWAPSQRARLLVRINPVDSRWYADDVTLLASLSGLGAVMLPKTESVDVLSSLAARLPGLPIVPLLESAEGFGQLNAIARGPQVLRLGLGHVDLQADLGISCSPDEAELGPARWHVVVETRRARLAPAVDGITTSTTDVTTVLQDTNRSRRFGFGGKLCIHPAQIPAVHEGFAPTESEVAWATRVLDAHALAGDGAFSVDGKMVDAPVIALARHVLVRASGLK